MALAWDRIHPNTTGHLIIARASLEPDIRSRLAQRR